MNATDQPSDSATFRGKSEKNFDTQVLRRVFTQVVIQEIPSRLYLSTGDFWTVEVEDATRFDSPSGALEAAANLKLKNIQLVTNRVTKEWEIVPVPTIA